MIPKTNSKETLVSISCITYNHVNYIKDAIEGFLVQKTSFKFEVLIHDDASTDGTEEIIRKYEAKYPDIIKPLYEKENQWVKGRKGSAVFNFPRAKGKYIALCEGDDYWTDPYKLQKQVDFLEANPHINLYYHKVSVNPKSKKIPFLNKQDSYFSFKDSLIGKNGTTLSLMFRNIEPVLDAFSKLGVGLSIGDWPLECLLTSQGNGFYSSEEMGCYRIHDGGATQKLTYKKYIIDRYIFLRKLLNSDFIDYYQKVLVNQVFRRILILMLLTPNLGKSKFQVLNELMKLKKTKKTKKIKYNDLLSISSALKRYIKRGVFKL